MYFCELWLSSIMIIMLYVEYCLLYFICIQRYVTHGLVVDTSQQGELSADNNSKSAKGGRI